jgi:hypothetical protein
MKYLRTLAFLLSIVLSPLIGLQSVQAQAGFGNFGIPTPSQRFSEEGRTQLEREIHRLQSPQQNSEDVLKIDAMVYKQQEDLIRLEDPRLHPESLPSEPGTKPGKSGHG